MKTVALVSGGKDSCFAALLAEQHGHEVVCLANLAPADAGVEDLDSWMYQTVGHGAMDAYATASGLPLYRSRIRGTARESRLSYRDTAEDEVEDLAALLRGVLRRHPEVAAVSSGAIASDYQRTRVERVCARLGLTSLAYMWHGDQGELLEAMLAAPIDAILLKVAAAGLRVERHLGARLADVAPQLPALRERFGLNLCGEGGEYETFCLDCPLFRRGRIEILESHVDVRDPDPFAPVANLVVTRWRVVGKGTAAEGVELEPSPVVWVDDDELEADALPQSPARAGAEPGAPAAPLEPLEGSRVRVTQLRAADGTVCVGAVWVREDDPVDAVPLDTGRAVRALLAAASASIASSPLSWEDAYGVRLFVPSMAGFAAANAAYGQVVPSVDPPTRACVEIPTAGRGGVRAAVEVLLAAGRGDRASSGTLRQSLHVQSVSDWAPACIGPYGQAARSPAGTVTYAGTIPLDPGSMVPIPGGVPQQLERAWRSCRAVSAALAAPFDEALLWATVHVAAEVGARGLEEAVAWCRATLETRELGGEAEPAPAPAGAGAEAGASRPAGVGTGAGTSSPAGPASSAGSDSSADSEDRPPCYVEDYLATVPCPPRTYTPPLLFLADAVLPRNVLVEIEPTLWDAAERAREEGEEEDDAPPSPTSSGDPASRAVPRWRRHLLASAADHPAACAGAGCRTHQVWSPGRVARGLAVASIPEAGPSPPLTGDEAHASAALAAASGALRQALSAVADRLGEAGLSAQDVHALRVYLGPRARSLAHSDALEAADAAGLPHPGLVVPVAALALDDGRPGDLAVEIVAAKIGPLA